METAYQKWEKRRQERTGGHRPALSHRRKKGSVALGPREKRRMAQLAVCLALFLVVFIGKGVFPGKLAEVRETVLSAIQADTDFKAAFASLGRSISEGEPILDTLGDLWVEVFGGEAVTVPDGEGQVSTPLFRAQAAFLSGFPAREDAVSHWLGEAGKPEPVAVEPAEPNTVPEPTPVPTATPEPAVVHVEYNGPTLPDNATMDRYNLKALGVGETVTPALGWVSSDFGWREHPVDGGEKFHNGVDLAVFDENRARYTVQDPDLEDPSVFKVVYTGSIRKVNHLGLLLDAAKEVTDPRVKFLIWGDGDQRAALEQRVREEEISNVVFKGKVEKKYIPSIVSRADINLIHGGDQGKELFRFGISPNKMFDCFAAGRPILMDLPAKYNPVEQFQAGICLSSVSEIPAAIRQIQVLSPQAYESLCGNARKAAARFDFRVLTQELMEILEKRG